MTTLSKSKEKDAHIKILCIIFLLPQKIAAVENTTLARKIDGIYYCEIKGKKDHTTKEDITDDNKTKQNKFGNTPIDSDIMKCILPHAIDRKTCEVNYFSKKSFVLDCLKNNKPYISGPSGMANCFCALFGILKIDIESEVGTGLINAMSAFIIGTAQHSKHEIDTTIVLMKKMYASMKK